MSQRTPRTAARAVSRLGGGVNGAGGWPGRLAGLWTDVLGGVVAPGRVGKALGPLVTKHGEALVADGWRRYLEMARRAGQAKREYLTVEDFGRRFGDFAPQARPAEPAPEPVASGPVFFPSRDELDAARREGRKAW